MPKKKGYRKKRTLKKLSWRKLKTINPRMKPFADSDGDGVPNCMDCRPLDNKKHFVPESDPYYWAYGEREEKK